MSADPARIQAALDALGLDPARFAARGLRAFAEARELISIGTDTQGREVLLAPAAAAAWQAMRRCAADAGVELLPVSGFRSYARQCEILRRKREAGLDWDAVLAVSAPPGYSEHHGGHALDLGTPGSEALQENFGDTAAFRWLCRHAALFDFYLSYPRGNAQGYDYEPWHWCWRGALTPR